MLRLLLAPLLGALIAVLASCRTLDDASAESTPYGIQLRERIDQWDRWCRREKLGPYNDGTRSKADATCDFLFLKDKRWDPDADEFSRYAHSIKLPAPHDKVLTIYRPGVSTDSYFRALCSNEAGEWVFRSTSGVTGVMQLRPSIERPRGLNQLLPHALEHVAYGSADDINWLSVLDSNSYPFSFFELPYIAPDRSIRIHRYYGSLEKLQRHEGDSSFHWRSYGPRLSAPYVDTSESRSRFGFVGRGVLRAEFEEAGVYGTELLVIDLHTREVLAFTRNFYAVRPAPNVAGQIGSEAITRACPNAPKLRPAKEFVSFVLKG